MEQRTLELTIISADDLKDVNHLSRMQTYAAAWIDRYVKYTTQIDKKGGANPLWDEKFMIVIPENLLQQPDARLTIEIVSQSLLGSKPVGKVWIPLSEIVKRQSGGRNERQLASYQVRTASGRGHGKLHLSLRLGEKFWAESIAKRVAS